MIKMRDRDIRGWDDQGNGKYLAKRGDRQHKGVDLVTDINEPITSPCAGTVTKIGYPYDPQNIKKGHLRYVQVTDQDKLKVRMFYVEPCVKIGDKIEEDQIIGHSQDLTQIYPGITQHVHFEIKRVSAYMNPIQYLYNNSLTT